MKNHEGPCLPSLGEPCGDCHRCTNLADRAAAHAKPTGLSNAWQEGYLTALHDTGAHLDPETAATNPYDDWHRYELTAFERMNIRAGLGFHFGLDQPCHADLDDMVGIIETHVSRIMARRFGAA